MPIHITENPGEKTVEIKVHGTLLKEDYPAFVAKFEHLVLEHGKLRVLFLMDDFHGWEAAAFWEDVKFDVLHFSDIERIAIIGDKAWEKGMAAFCKPFIKAESRCFDRAQLAEARGWLAENQSHVCAQ